MILINLLPYREQRRKQRVYRRHLFGDRPRDASGQWQITDRPPADRPYEEVRVDPRQKIRPPTARSRTIAPLAR